jgi:hypothetical protein
MGPFDRSVRTRGKGGNEEMCFLATEDTEVVFGVSSELS